MAAAREGWGARQLIVSGAFGPLLGLELIQEMLQVSEKTLSIGRRPRAVRNV